MKLPLHLIAIAACLTCGGFSHAQVRNIELPSLGETGTLAISPDQEAALGEAWLRAFYRQTPLYRDYLIQDYVESLTYRLLPYSGLDRTHLSVLVVNHPTMNAFAVPGGVIGVHTGLILHAQDEDELASVVAHELAHISQRHFARSLDTYRMNSIAGMAGLLASIVVAATAGADAGMAMMSLAQGATLESQLRYSRQNEIEADRIGQDTLVRAGMDPRGTVRMFERMLAATRFAGELAPEYLLTHPLPQSRVADAETRATRFSASEPTRNPNYALLRTRIQVQFAETPQTALRNFTAHLQQNPESKAAIYGFALASAGVRNWDDAKSSTSQLLADDPANLIFQSLWAQILYDSGEFEKAHEYLSPLLQERPGNHVLTMQMATLLNRLNRFEEAAQLLTSHSKRRQEDPVVWYELAEAQGLAGDVYQLHLARAEYFVRVGAYDRAIDHLRQAKREMGENAIEQAVLDERIRTISTAKAREMAL